MSKLILIDGNAILYRAFYALPPMTNRKGEPIGALYGLVSMLLRVIQDLKPTHLAVCFDEKEKTFRHKALASYQAQRPPMPSELDYQSGSAKKFLKAAGIPVYSKPGFEADDVIGTIASQSADKIEEVVIVTGDRDQLQLIDDGKGIKLYMPVSGLSSAKLTGERETKEKMGVKPHQIPVYKALVGDPSDNYKGVAGIGPKTAIGLVQRFESLDQIYKNLDKISVKIKEKLKKDRKNAFLSLKLATIVIDVPVNFNLEESGKWDIDSQKVLDLFSEFGFKTLAERVKSVGKKLDAEQQGKLF